MRDEHPLISEATATSLGTARLDRRDVLRGATAGLTIPALAMASIPNQASAQAATPASSAWTGTALAAQTTSGGLSPERLNRLREVMEGHIGSGLLPGLVLGIVRRGETHVDALGMTTIDGNDPMRRDTIFRIASVTKPIVAVAAMILVEETVLRLDDPVDPLLPELADRQVLRSLESDLDDTVPANRPITLRDLLTFRLGYGAIFAPPGQYPIADAMTEAGVASGPLLPELTPDEYMQAFEDLPLLHQPGEQWLYDTGADMLGVLIMRATDMSLEDFFQERIFSPLGMQDTSFSVPADKLDRLAGSYWTNFETGEYEVFDGIENSRWSRPPVFESGASGLVSTVDDLLVFGQMMLDNGTLDDQRMLSRPAVELMTTDHITLEQKAASPPTFTPNFWANRGWGFGVAINTRRDNLWETPGRYGWDGGYGTSWYVDPEEELIGVFLAQRVWDGSGVLGAYADFWALTYQAIDD
jgi:CubicO group peptidase (beta-lactamase class C family)